MKQYNIVNIIKNNLLFLIYQFCVTRYVLTRIYAVGKKAKAI